MKWLFLTMKLTCFLKIIFFLKKKVAIRIQYEGSLKDLLKG